MKIFMALLALAAAAVYYNKRMGHEEESERSGALLLLIVSGLAVAAFGLHLVPEAVMEAYGMHVAALLSAVAGWLGLRKVKRVLKSIPAAAEPIPMAE